MLRPHGFITDVDESNDDDTSSIGSFSTTATADDLPGTGRTLDTYFFQPAGRRVEKLLLRVAIRYLHPWRISAVIEGNFGITGIRERKNTINDCFNGLSNRKNQATGVSGLKSLVRQAQ